MRAISILALLVSAVVLGCGPDETTLETRTFQLQHLDARSAFAVAEPYVFDDHPDAPGRISMGEESRTLTVRERPANLDRIARVLDENDRPAPQATLHFRVIEARQEEAARVPELADLEDTLRDVFRFGSYRLVGEALARVVEGGTIDQRVSGPGAHLIGGTLWSVNADEEGPTAGRLSLTLWTDQNTRGLETTVNVVDGQTLVVGTAGEGGNGGAIILTVRPEFQE